VISILINVGMFLERLVLIVTTLAYSYDPGAWGLWHLQWVEVAIVVGSFGWFMLQFLLFVQFAPSLPVAEVKREVIEGRRMLRAFRRGGLLPHTTEEVTPHG
jgi:molybdopterin-containing oxidoreductase family membrane subunit